MEGRGGEEEEEGRAINLVSPVMTYCFWSVSLEIGRKTTNDRLKERGERREGEREGERREGEGEGERRGEGRGEGRGGERGRKRRGETPH